MSHLFIALALAAATTAVAQTTKTGGPTCKAAPGSASWPSPDLWAGLNATVGGQLIKTVPPGSVCHQQQPAFSTSLCPLVLNAWSNEYFHSEDPVSVEWNNWNNDTCLPIPSYPCSGEGYPVYVVNATTPLHVKAGVDFGEFSLRAEEFEGVELLGEEKAEECDVWCSGVRVSETDSSQRESTTSDWWSKTVGTTTSVARAAATLSPSGSTT